MWPLAVILNFALLTGVGFAEDNYDQKQPKVQNSFWGIDIKATKSDIQFIKGKPNQQMNYSDLTQKSGGIESNLPECFYAAIPKKGPNNEDEVWIYKFYENLFDKNATGHNYIISFKDNKIFYIRYAGSEGNKNPELQGIKIYDSSDKIIKKFGEPTNISLSGDQLGKIYSYKKYKVFFELVRDRVVAFGVYNQH